MSDKQSKAKKLQALEKAMGRAERSLYTRLQLDPYKVKPSFRKHIRSQAAEQLRTVGKNIELRQQIFSSELSRAALAGKTGKERTREALKWTERKLRGLGVKSPEKYVETIRAGGWGVKIPAGMKAPVVFRIGGGKVGETTMPKRPKTFRQKLREAMRGKGPPFQRSIRDR